MLPQWLFELANVFLAVSVLSAIVITVDILNGRRQKMGIMDIVWPVTALYLGPFALWAYYAFGRQQQVGHAMQGMSSMAGVRGMGQMGEMPHHDMSIRPDAQQTGRRNPSPQSTFIGASHCGAGCVLGDFIGEWLVFLTGWTIAGQAIWADYAADFTLAFLFGIAFQYFSIVPMRHLSPGKGLMAALKADTLSIFAFEVGMFAWMAFSRFVLFKGHPLHPNESVYWFMMQIAMWVGFATTYPMNKWLIRHDVKEAM